MSDIKTSITRKDIAQASLGVFLFIAFVLAISGFPWSCEQAQDKLVEAEQKFNERKRGSNASQAVVSGAYSQMIQAREKVRARCNP